MEKTKRNSSVELLRILAMLMIVAHHYASFGFFAEDLAFSRNKLFVDLFGMSGHVGVNLFVLISGYFMVSARFHMKKLLTLMGSIWFYTLGALVVILGAGLLPFSLNYLKLALFPLLTSHYWFMSYYVILMLLSPFLNALIRAISRERLAVLCLLLVALCLLLPEFLHVSFAGGMLPLFVLLYLCGAWCRLYVPQDARLGRRFLLLTLGLYLAISLWVGITDFSAQKAGDLGRLCNSLAFLDVYSPFSFAAALLLLLAGICREPGQNALFNRLGGLTFGVYLLHTNQLVSTLVWQRLFHTAEFADSPWLVLHALGTVAALFAAGCLLEWLRQRSVGRLWEQGVDALLQFWEKKRGVRL